MRVMLLATRDPAGQQSGRKTVLNTQLQSLVALGHEVDLVVLARRAPAPWPADDGVRVHHVPVPGIAQLGRNLVVRGLNGRQALNECLYYSPALARRVRSMATRLGSDVLVADMIRTADLAFAAGPPVILDLDDLLSRRYEQLAAQAHRQGRGANANLLGYHGENLPPALVAIASWVARCILRREARVLRRRELECARRAAVVSLVSPVESASFGQELGASVACLPMAVSPPPAASTPSSNGARVLFTGKLDYEPNLAALRWFRSDIAPELVFDGLRLDVAGHCPAPIREEFADAPVRFLGYVDDLFDELCRGRVFLAPITMGTGVKTKVLEAMAAGLPVVSTPLGVEGIGVTHGVTALIGDSGPDLARHVRGLLDDGARADAIGAAGREHVLASFAPDVLRARWSGALAQARPLPVALGGSSGQSNGRSRW